MENTKKSQIGGSEHPTDIYLQVFHKLGVDNADAYRNPENIRPDDLVNEIESKAKMRMADAPEIVTKYTNTGQQQAKEQLIDAVRQNIGLADEKLDTMDYTQIMRRIKDELLSRASQDAKGWELERSKLHKEIEDLKRHEIPSLKNKYEEKLAKVTKQTWFMRQLLGKELTHKHEIVMNALLPELEQRFEVKPVGQDNFTIVNKDGTRIADAKGIRFLEDDEIIVRELENSGFLRQQNTNANALYNRYNVVGVNNSNLGNNQNQNQNQNQNPSNVPVNARSNQSDSQRTASSKNRERMAGFFNANYQQ